ncbi:SDR family NAD(P)-dependent oxidoreductase [Aeoliella mucimassa]|uniref:3-oxoacyl-[acyl-carrier-protein] reductase FabG n=1 Tax=Aeoliella mucimassa TaxID=2527972 RepID=A0A518ATG3_9BACT|nr:SDR family oxidoreductase [Aeoliella mucimassa]QDU58018.1 3-oxoacyl-[acyl-carrier-protein] reductase FabG [Aeoliella mucimassa]
MSQAKVEATKRCYLVFGASGGIGSSVASQLVAQGHHVVLASRDSERLTQLADQLQMPCEAIDAADFEEVERVFAKGVELRGQVDGAVNCVGSVLLKPAHLTSFDELQQTIAANLFSAFAVVRAAAKHVGQGGSSVVLISSAAARIGLANHEAIAAAKAGVEGLTRSASATYARKGLRVNAIAPGLVKTKLTERIWKSERAATHSEAMHALGRLGEPGDIASGVLWLLDPTNQWITGEVIGFDGGLGRIKL